MRFPGNAALLLSFDVADGAIEAHDDWHTHEHFPERLAIPGFLRGSRWVAQDATPRYFVMYEVEDIATLTSAAYLERLNNPTPWTRSMMASYVGMRRALCHGVAGFGGGMGGSALLIRFAPDAGRDANLREWLACEALPPLVARAGIASARLFASGAEAPVTSEQLIRGIDAGLQAAVVVTGYDRRALAALADDTLAATRFAANGASMRDWASGVYRLAYSLTAGEAMPAS